uniref:Uncharacterized protein n=1 Tax=Anopheles quadriannulatus TaxID=34691 RepID=A0A182X5G4_ANOQN
MVKCTRIEMKSLPLDSLMSTSSIPLAFKSFDSSYKFYMAAIEHQIPIQLTSLSCGITLHHYPLEV